MFEHNKNKEAEKESMPEIKANSDAVFHTMRDDLKAMGGKITLDEKKDNAGAEEMESKKTREENKRVSPFSGNVLKKPSDAAASSSPVPLRNNHAGKSPMKSRVSIKKRSVISKFIISAIIILIIASVALGSYILWKTRNSDKIEPKPPEEVPIEKPQPTETPIEKYSSENPNYLSIDTESATSESISQLLKQTASEIKESENGKLFEFVVTDANNNPLSFSIFSYLFKISLSPEILDSLEENFSLYFYRDNENVRLGAAVDIQDTEAISSEISKEENALVSELQPLFLSNPFSEIGESFNTSQYKDFQIRYINLNEDNTLSVDYSIAGDKLIIGTSKDTARAIIDKMQQSNAAADTENTSAEDTDIEL